MHNITIQIETITPIFLSGEDQSAFELRPPSFKGLLRFWWRAYFWGHHPGDASPKEIHQQMAQKEGELFGNASENGRKSRFSLRILNKNNVGGATAPFPKQMVKATGSPKSFRINILEYLAYGTQEYQRGDTVFIRPYLPPQSEFALKLTFANHPPQNEEQDKTSESDILLALYFLSTFGSVGSKSRNGFGSFRIKQVDADPSILQHSNFSEPFPSREFLERQIRNHKTPNIPDFTALSRQMKIFALKKTASTWDECLAELGEIYRSCKGSLDAPLSCEKRQYIGAPITIQKRIGGRWKKYDTSFLERRAKPYFLRVIRTGQGFQGYIVYLPSDYCDGIDKDKYGKQLNHHKVDQDFRTVCDEFNNHLARQMEVYYG